MLSCVGVLNQSPLKSRPNLPLQLALFISVLLPSTPACKVCNFSCKSHNFKYIYIYIYERTKSIRDNCVMLLIFAQFSPLKMVGSV